MNTIEKLIEEGILTFAREPQANPSDLNFEAYTITLIEHDYPAKTPVMWNSVYKHFSLPYGNIMFVADVSQLDKIVQAFRNDPKYLGGGMGVGFKDEIIPFLDSFNGVAREIGAVNFVKKGGDNSLVGYNTDGSGYADSLEEEFSFFGEELLNKNALILGAGGTGNAIAFSLAERGLNLVILNRTVSKAQDLANKINEKFSLSGSDSVIFDSDTAVEKYLPMVDVIINVSTKGSAGDMQDYSALAPAILPVSKENIEENIQQSKKLFSKIPKDVIISDIILRNENTPMLEMASKKGNPILDGKPMVVNQGVTAIWAVHGSELEKKGIKKKQVSEIMKKAAGL